MILSVSRTSHVYLGITAASDVLAPTELSSKHSSLPLKENLSLRIREVVHSVPAMVGTPFSSSENCLYNMNCHSAFAAHTTGLGASVLHRSAVKTRALMRRPRRLWCKGLKMQTWSDPAVTQEYMDYLTGTNQRVATSDCRSTIVGGRGRLGNFLRSQGDGSDLVLTRGDEIPEDAPGPVYLCTRNDELEEIIRACPASKRDDLVFLQNGMLEPLLRNYGLSDCTRANIYFAVSSVGADPIDGKTVSNPEGLTSVCGKWEGALQERLINAGLSCKIQKERDFRRGQLEKLIWICAFNLVGAVHGNITMGQVAQNHETETTELILELAQMVRFHLTVGMMPDIEKRLLAYARSVKDFPTGLKEFKWRNGFFYDHSQVAKSNSFPDPTPMHSNYLEEGKAMNLINWP